MSEDKKTTTQKTTLPHTVPGREQASHSREDGAVPPHAVQEQEELQAAVQQQTPEERRLSLNEGGRTNDSSETENPAGAVHGLPKPSMKGTWR